VALGLVGNVRAIVNHVNQYYRVFKGIDYDHLTLKADHASTAVLTIQNDGGGASLVLADSAGSAIFAGGEAGTVNSAMTQSQRFRASGTALVTGDVALSAGWGTSASVTTVEGSDGAFRIRVVAGTAAWGPNPTITVTFTDGTWTTTPIVICQQTVGTTSTGILQQNVTATGVVITTQFTPAINGEVFWFTFLVMGR
jgi:hypothetical protein